MHYDMTKQWRYWICAVFLLCVTFVLAGCGGQAPTEKKTNVAMHTVTDSTGKEVTLPVHPDRIVSYGVSTDDMVLGLVNVDRVAAISDLPGNEEAKRKEVKGRVKGSTEMVVSYHPDLILMPSWSNPSLISQLRELNLPVYVYRYPTNIAETESTIHLIGGLVDEPDRANQIVTNMQNELDAISDFTEKVPKSQRKIAAFYAYGGFGGGPGTLFDEFCQVAHLENAARLAGLSGNETGSLEQLVAVNPDIIFIPTALYDSGDYHIGSVQSILENPGLQGVRAVQNHAVYAVDARWLLNYSQFLVNAVAYMAKEAYGYGK